MATATDPRNDSGILLGHAAPFSILTSWITRRTHRVPVLHQQDLLHGRQHSFCSVVRRQKPSMTVDPCLPVAKTGGKGHRVQESKPSAVQWTYAWTLRRREFITMGCRRSKGRVPRC